jgi:hypothetical protein
MKVKLALNIGDADRQRLQLGESPEDVTEGTVLDVKQPVADELLRRGWAVQPGEPVGQQVKTTPPPANLRGVPSTPDAGAANPKK